MLKTFFQDELIEAGCDEAGRGCLAGPVYAGAVIFPKDYHNPELNDSKQLTAKRRAQLREVIQREAIAWGVGVVSEKEIDRINILRASILAMHRALEALSIQPGFIIVDGNRFSSYRHLPFRTIVKGDAKYLSIAAASILAKTCRDDFMDLMDKDYPQYSWSRNKGYPTQDHREAIARYGPCPLHRMSFRLLKDTSQLSLEFPEDPEEAPTE